MLVQAGVPTNFTAVFDGATPDYVAFSVYENGVLLLSPVVMTHINSNVYSGSFTPEVNKLYTVFMLVYTDGTFVTLDGAFNSQQQAQAVTAQYLIPKVQSVAGFVDCGGN